MRKRIISESFENRMHELSGIIQENAHKIMKLGFDNNIADYLAGIDKKRGMFFANSLTQQYIKDKGLSELEGMNAKQALGSINQEDLFNYMKSRENEILMISDWVKQGQGKIDLKPFNSFNEVVSTAASELAPSEEEAVEAKEEGFSSEVDSYLKALDYDFGIELGKIALKGYFEYEYPELNSDAISTGEMIQAINQEDFLRFLKENENELHVVIVWVLTIGEENNLSREEKNDFLKGKNYKNLGEALSEANEWHLNLPASGKLKTPWAGRKVEEYADGFYWVDLDTNNSPDEGQAMGHCGADGAATTLLSLRNPQGGPHITIAYNENTKNIAQVKGKQNKRPIDKYMKYAEDFLGKMIKKGKVESFNWSYPAYGKDLSDKEVGKALEDNLSAKAKFKIAKKGVPVARRRRMSGGNLGVRY